MKKILLVSLITFFVCLSYSSVYASDPSFIDIMKNTKAYKGQEQTLTGEIISCIFKLNFSITISELNKPEDNTLQKSEINLYSISDGTESLYLLTTKSYQEKQQVTVKSKILLTSKGQIDNDSNNLIDQYILRKTETSSSDSNNDFLQGIKGLLPRNKYWVLMIETE